MHRERRNACLVFWLALMCFLTSATRAVAHDLWLNIDNHYPKAGEKSAVKVVFGHNYPYYDILIKRDSLASFSCLCPDGQMREVTDIWEDRMGERSGALVGEIVFEREGTYVVTAFRKVRGDKEHVPSEKYAKSIVVAGKGSKNVSKVFGHRIEIVPLRNPLEIKGGGTLPVKVLFEGKPLSTYVYATYASYHSEDEPFPVAVRSNAQGVANITINQPGVWMVVSNHKVDFSASLTFEVR